MKSGLFQTQKKVKEAKKEGVEFDCFRTNRLKSQNNKIHLRKNGIFKKLTFYILKLCKQGTTNGTQGL